MAASTYPRALASDLQRVRNEDAARKWLLSALVRRPVKILGMAAALTLSATAVQAQSTTYHLHNETSAVYGNYKQLKTAGPDVPAVTLQSADLKNSSQNVSRVIETFETQSGDPNVTGTIAAESIVNLTMWMRKTADFGTFHPYVTLHLNNYAGAGSVFVCWIQSGSSPVTINLQPFNLQCNVPNEVLVTPSDRFYLQVGVWVTAGPGNKTVKAELRIEGALEGDHDSRLTIPLVVTPPEPVLPAISSLSPQSGVAGTSVTVTGINFGSSPPGTLSFNGIPASPTSWQGTSIVAPVPAGATTGPVVVTTSEGSSVGVPFAVFTTGTLAGTISRASDATPVSGAVVDALQSGIVKATQTTGPAGTYSIAGLLSGSYDLRVSAAGFATEIEPNLAVGNGANTTANVALSVPGQIGGRVTTTDGTTPIAGAAVSASLGTSTVNATVTNTAGDYVLAGLVPGTYSVEATADGYQPVTQGSVALAEGGAATANFALPAATTGAVKYIYDELGRLVSVVDAAGQSATYEYDAVGNILSISRTPAGAVTISEFTPNSGAIGSTVHVFGTGFSSTPAQNTLSFAGPGPGDRTVATVTVATATELVTTVPVGAITGTIAVTTPSGSATSGTVFTVATAGGPPTITVFTPSIGVPGTLVTITGTNFQTTLGNNRVAFNLSQTSVTSATPTSLGTPVTTASTSGRITVATPFGTAMSTDDFFVPPAPYTPADVVDTARLPDGAAQLMELNAAEKIGLAVFDGAANQRISINITDVTVPSGTVKVYSPYWVELASSTFGWGDALVEPLTLPHTGTYSVLLDPTGTSTGSFNLTLHTVPADVTGIIAIGGDPFPVPIGTPGQNARLTFGGTVDQRIGLLMTGTIASSLVAILNPDGSTLVQINPVTSSGAFIDTTVLPSTGTYTILLNPYIGHTGSMTFSLLSVSADFSGTIAPGSSAPIPTLTPGQNARLTFTGAANQVVSVLASDVEVPSFTLRILRPDGTTLTSSSGFIDATALPTAGTYTLEVDPSGAASGSMTVTLYNVVDSIGTITAGGPLVTVDMPTPGQNGRRTFTGTAGQRISLTVSAGPLGTVSILRPDGTTLASRSMTVLAVYFDTVTLPSNGTYTILVDPLNAATGSVTLVLHNDVSGTVTINSPAVTVAISAPGQNGTRTFSGKNGVQVTVRIAGNTFGSVTIRLLRPDGTLMTTSTSSNGSFDLLPQMLTSTGTYRIEIDPSLGNTGSLQLSVTTP